MNYTRGPWYIHVRPPESTGVSLKWLTVEEDSGPLYIVDEHDVLVAAVVHRPGKGQGFSETVGNSQLIENAPELLRTAAGLVRALRNGEEHEGVLQELEDLLERLPVVSST